ncbi:ABC transporter permease [Methanosarcina sp.]|uniref:ABC transporter permease n=1 Tax=Methanosarcina sp. TaxID=2213 RepID=UPI002ABB13DA|nr:ABC transporter permease [Methanosarcina sp.]MDY9926071.1 ABC transporter permease [Methanosarcina sp.]
MAKNNLTNKKIKILSVLLTVLVITALSLFTYSQITNGYCTETIPPGNIIAIYQVDYTYGDLNAVYVRGAGLDIDSENYDRMITYEDIPHIASMDGVENVILYDTSYLDTLIYKTASEDRLLDKLNLIAVPESIAQDYLHQTAIPYGTGYLEEGRLPRDGAHEITISKKLLKKHFAYTDEMLTRAIGSKVNYDNETYTITGINSYDICYIFFDPERNYGLYQYDADTFDEFVTRNIDYKKTNDYFHPEYANEIFIYTADGSEKSVLDKLFQEYPAENYISSEYVSVWKKTFNGSVLRKIIIINSIVVTLLGIILLLLNKKPISKV